MNPKTIIGLEIHVQLPTQSKLFCGCSTRGGEPNSSTCPICLGHPGAKPVLNRAAVDWAIKIALAFGCAVNSPFFFSRKTYFYPDLSKNFQITQFEIPLGKSGVLELESGKKVRIRRIHLEEDPAALVHEKGFSLVDYNRSGIPLVEIVTEPDLESAGEAREFLNKLVSVLEFLGALTLGEGALKADCNLSLSGHSKVELKNISGFQAVEKALLAEEKRQRELLAAGDAVQQQTRGFDEKANKTFLQREKESEADYGYIFEPDLVQTVVDKDWLSAIQKSIPELPKQKALRFQKQFLLSAYDAQVLCSGKKLSDLFEELVQTNSPDLVCRFLSRELLGILNYNKLGINSVGLKAVHLSELLSLVASGSVSEKNAKQATIEYVLNGVPPVVFLGKNDLLVSVSGSDVDAIVSSVLSRNPNAVADLKAGNQKSLNFLVGLVMRETKGKIEPRLVQKKIEEKIR